MSHFLRPFILCLQGLHNVVKGKMFVPPLILKAPGENGHENMIIKE